MRYYIILFMFLVFLIGACNPEQKIIEAYYKGNKKIAYEYVESGKNVNIASEELNCTLLMLASDKSDQELIDMIFSSSTFDIKYELEREFNILHMVASKNDIETLKKLLSKLGNININSSSFSPLAYAVLQNNKEVMEILLKYPNNNINFAGHGKNKMTVLHLAVIGGNLDAVKTLLNYSPDDTITDINHYTPLQIAKLTYQKTIDKNSEYNEKVVKDLNKEVIKDLKEIIKLLEAYAQKDK